MKTIKGSVLALLSGSSWRLREWSRKRFEETSEALHSRLVQED